MSFVGVSSISKVSPLHFLTGLCLGRTLLAEGQPALPFRKNMWSLMAEQGSDPPLGLQPHPFRCRCTHSWLTSPMQGPGVLWANQLSL